ncbi:MAG: tRNA uridine-5-carboxymethylaminomethyl(34) synthesis GTPase MnmE [Erysipelotrichaceae bacterium]|nr:tRNA uridine-5-carboxymethylaminomethyl(34) synthesis GTPase MnmE [Erysipelotrichaceae bacterium]
MVDNICAIATPYGTGAISVIRCSGPNAIELVNNVFKGKNLNKCLSHTIHYGYIIDNENIVDEVLCNIFKAPRSFDGENTVEINCHGGVFVTNQVLQVLLRNGFRMAENGEFSKRAFLNKRLDLTQAEAIMDIISSTNSLALKSSTNSLRSRTSKLVKDFREKLLDILAKIEVNIDYPEYDDAVEVTNNYLTPIVDELINEMNVILYNSSISTIAIHGIKTAIVGKPNVGKSSLLNMLLDEDKAIVSSIAGTTRDLVEGTLNIRNITLHLIDTAGIRESDDYVESIGIERSQKAILSADLVLLVLDSSNPLEEEDYKLLELTRDKKRVVIANKKDLDSYWSLEDVIYISAKNKDGIDELAERIYEITNLSSFNVDEGRYLNNNRQVALMDKAYNSLLNAKNAISMGVDIDLIEIDIKDAFDALGEITGESYPEELITALFTKFCLGK